MRMSIPFAFVVIAVCCAIACPHHEHEHEDEHLGLHHGHHHHVPPRDDYRFRRSAAASHRRIAANEDNNNNSDVNESELLLSKQHQEAADENKFNNIHHNHQHHKEVSHHKLRFEAEAEDLEREAERLEETLRVKGKPVKPQQKVEQLELFQQHQQGGQQHHQHHHRASDLEMTHGAGGDDEACAGMYAHYSLVPLPREIVYGQSCLPIHPADTQVLYHGSAAVSEMATSLSSMLRLSTAPQHLPDSWLSSHHAAPAQTLNPSKLREWRQQNKILLVLLQENGNSTMLGQEGYRGERYGSEHIGPEGYMLLVSSSHHDTSSSSNSNEEGEQQAGMVVVANTEAGLVHAMATVRLMLSPDVDSSASHSGKIALPEVMITDWPVFSWRGMHLDVSRHFFNVQFVKKFIDLLALHKMNRFHWHLTDDQGWRIPIPSFPKLTEIGAWRTEGSRRYGGAYTREEVAEVVAYAAARYITVVPEIEMPGHAQAAIAAYPHLGCPDHPNPQVWTDWGVSKDAFCAGNPESISFLEKVLLETIEMFPGAYVHVGGDECDKTHWRHCSRCQHRMREEGLETPEQLQASFTSHMSKFLAQHGKRLVGWDEILEGGLDKGATVMSWRGVDGGVEAARRGLDAVMTPMNYAYFDRSYRDGDRLGRFGTLPLRDTYEWQVIPDNMETNIRKHIVGGQGNVWTEGMASEGDVEYLSLPRMAAVAETLWSPSQSKSWNSFRTRLHTLTKHYDTLGVQYYHEPSVDAAAPQLIDQLRSSGHVPSHVRDLETDTDRSLARDAHFYHRMFTSNGSPV